MKSLDLKNILILGGSGFIGTNLILDLIDKDINIHVYDINSSKIITQLKEENKIKLIVGNFVTERNFDKLLENIDCIIHLIHTTIPFTSNKNIIYDVESNLISSLKLFEAAVKSRVKKIIFISSGGTIYGNVENCIPIKEESRTEPLSSYGIVKLAIEKYLKLLTNSSNTKFVILRPSNPYGGISYHTGELLGLINIALLKTKRNGLLTIWGNGSNIRDYIHVSDLTNAIIKSIFIKQNKNFIINIGAGITKSILEVLDLIEDVTGKKLDVRFIDSRKVDINYNVLDIKKSFELIQWKPLIKIEVGIRRTWNEISCL